MRVAIYCRVSTKEQTTENQTRDLKAYCEARQLEIFNVYSDHGISGSASSRPELDRLMLDAKNKKFDSVLVWKFDRFARSTSHLLSALNKFQELGIDFISYNEGVDTSTSVGKMIFTFLSAISEFEKSIIIERTNAGIRRARAQGKTLGRPKSNFNIDQAISLKAQGLGLRPIAKIMGVSYSTVRNYFKKLQDV